jgi:hypothetical protein
MQSASRGIGPASRCKVALIVGLFVDTIVVGFLQAFSHCHGHSLFGLGFHSPMGLIPNSDNQIIVIFCQVSYENISSDMCN